MRKFIDIAEAIIVQEWASPEINGQLIAAVVQELWDEVDSDSVDFDMILDLVSREGHEVDFDDRTIDELSLDSDEGREVLRAGFDSAMTDRVNEVLWTLERHFEGDRLPVWRVITAPKDWEPSGHPGIYWSWDKSAADAHWGDFSDGKIQWLLTAHLAHDQIDWIATLRMNAHWSFEEEREIRAKEGTPIEYTRAPLGD